MRVCMILLVLSLAGSASAAELVQEIPKQFRGEWNAVPADCGTGDNDSPLRISNLFIEFWESEGPIKAVVVHGRYEVAIIAELSGEGQTWLSTAKFRLSPSEDKLIYGLPGEEFVRYRCPEPADRVKS